MDEEKISNKSQCFLPDFCNIRMTLAVVMTAELLAVILSVSDFSSRDQFWSELGMQSLYIQWIALGSSAGLCLAKKILYKLSAGWSGFVAVLIILVTTFLVTHISYEFLQTVDERKSYLIFHLQGLVISFIIALLLMHYFYLQNQLIQKQQAESQARFDALQARIRPHFLFNSMNTIALLTRKDPMMAESVVEDLADLFRASLSSPDKVSTLGKEIELVKGYLNIESMRLAKRLRVTWRLDESLNSVKMPTLMLQPLIENAIYHGVETSGDGGDVGIEILSENQQVIINIQNTVNKENRQMHREGNRMAQKNTKQRLLAFYGAKARFDVEDSGLLYRVVLIFPLNDKELNQ